MAKEPTSNASQVERRRREDRGADVGVIFPEQMPLPWKNFTVPILDERLSS